MNWVATRFFRAQPIACGGLCQERSLRTKKAIAVAVAFVYLVAREELFFLLLAVTAVEFINAAGGVDELHLTSVERVRCVRNLDLYYRVLNAFDSDGLLGVGTRTCNEHVVV